MLSAVLPYEVVLEIISLLPPADVAAVALVARTWRDATRDDLLFALMYRHRWGAGPRPPVVDLGTISGAEGYSLEKSHRTEGGGKRGGGGESA